MFGHTGVASSLLDLRSVSTEGSRHPSVGVPERDDAPGASRGAFKNRDL